MLKDVEDKGEWTILSFSPHGRAFVVRDVDAFVKTILPQYFNQTSWHSFTRQLSLYGFRRIHNGSSPDYGAYYHELFLRGHTDLCRHMRRVGVPRKQTDRRKTPSKSMDHQDPDFFQFKALYE
jgi:hypothetical protein